MNSLRLRLMAIFGLLIVVASVTLGIYSSRMAENALLHYVRAEPGVARPPVVPLAELGETLKSHFAQRGNWVDSEILLNALAVELPRTDLLLIDAQQNVVGCTKTDVDRKSIELEANGELSLLQAGPGDDPIRMTLKLPSLQMNDTAGNPIGCLMVIPDFNKMPPLADALEPQRDVMKTLNRWLLIGTTVVGLLTLALAWYMARRLLGPIDELTLAAGQMALGNLDFRVRATSRDEFGKLGRAFNAMADSLARVEELRRNLVSDVAHELRTPLTNIRCQLESVRDGVAEATPELMASLHEETMLLNRLVHDLQEMAQAEAGQLPLHAERIDLAAEVEKAVAGLRTDEGGLPLPVEIDLPPGVGVIFDRNRFCQIIRNLVGNAIEHSGSGSPVRISARVGDEEVEIRVIDSGVGIAPEDLPNVFERFYRSDKSRSRSTGGAGLGLAIVKQLVEASGGMVGVESRPEEGASFFFTIRRVG